jgi:twinkle protein
MPKAGLLTAIIVVGQTEREIQMERENQVNPMVLEWFAKRGISQKTVELMGIYSGRHRPDGDGFRVEPNPEGTVIVFPYYRHGVVVNEKYRTTGKKFYQMRGGTSCFWNSDILSHANLTEGHNALLIVEGEMDALSVMEAGYPYVVSVPNGAPPPLTAGIEVGDIDPEHDEKFSYVLLDWEILKLVKRIIIAVDSDSPGKRLAEELVRRLGRVRCSFVTYPDDCKDFNDVLMRGGPSEITTIIARSSPYPISGIYTLEQLPVEPDLEPVSTGWGRLDDYLRPFYPAFMVVTGPAGSGKSTWTNQLVAQLAYKHGWKAAIASFEMRVQPFVTDTLAAVKRERNPGADELDVQRWINQNFVFIAPEPANDSESYDIEWLIEKAEAAVIRHGIRVLVIDPWNEIEHATNRKELLTDYTGRAIRALKRFGREFQCLVIVVAHPTKVAADKDPQKISLYDISDSAHFANKADFGVAIARLIDEGGIVTMESMILVKKIRYQPVSGQPGMVQLTYDPNTRTFGQ